MLLYLGGFDITNGQPTKNIFNYEIGIGWKKWKNTELPQTVGNSIITPVHSDLCL